MNIRFIILNDLSPFRNFPAEAGCLDYQTDEVLSTFYFKYFQYILDISLEPAVTREIILKFILLIL